MTGFIPDQDRWRALLRRIAAATRNPGDAEDLLQAAFVRLEEYRARTAVQNPATFLVRTAVNLAHDERRRRAVRERMEAWTAAEPDPRDESPLQDEVVAAQERLARVRAGLARLSPRVREVFLMHRLDGMKYREIAAKLSITVSAVEKHIAKAALALGACLEED